MLVDSGERRKLLRRNGLLGLPTRQPHVADLLTAEA
jgi:hypothetical protein